MRTSAVPIKLFFSLHLRFKLSEHSVRCHARDLRETDVVGRGGGGGRINCFPISTTQRNDGHHHRPPMLIILSSHAETQDNSSEEGHGNYESDNGLWSMRWKWPASDWWGGMTKQLLMSNQKASI